MKKLSLRRWLSTTNTLVIMLLIYTAFSFIFVRLADPIPSITQFIHRVDLIICCIIFIYFWRLFFRSNNKLKFMRLGWIVLLAALPAVGPLRDWDLYVRLLRFLLIIKLFHNDYNDSSNEIKITLMMGVLVLLLSTILILYFENVPEGNIKTAEDAIYWAIITIATVGYGDLYPVTTGGRIVAIVLLFAGVSIFVSCTGFFANWLRSNNSKTKDDEHSD